MKESTSERLLGLEVKNDLTWSAHLYGNGLKGKDKSEGLLTKLSKRVGVLKKVRRFMKPKQFHAASHGMFTSKLTFGIQVFGNNNIIIINGLFAVIKYKVQSFKQSSAVYKILVLWNL